MPIRLAVVGAGHLGRIHARLAHGLDDVQLIGVVDPDPSVRQTVSEQCDVPTYADCAPIIGRIDGAVVAAPTRHHHAITLDLLNRGIHVLVEKPITSTVEQADELETELLECQHEHEKATLVRERLLAELDAGLRRRYERVFMVHGHESLVSFRNGACSGCGAKVPPQIALELETAGRVESCQGCGRLVLGVES